MWAAYRRRRARQQTLQLATLELEARRAATRGHVNALTSSIRQQCSQPGTLLLAAGVGFALERCQSSSASKATGDAAAPARASLLSQIMAVLPLASAVFNLLPAASADDPAT